MLHLVYNARQLCTKTTPSMNLVHRMGFPVHSPEERSKAVGELKERVEQNRDCFGYQVESMITSISLEVTSDSTEIIPLMKACGRDILDYYPEQQKRLTWNAYNTAKKVQLNEKHTSHFHNISLDAFLFQNVNFDPHQFLRDMEIYQVNPNVRTFEGLQAYFCRKKDMDSAISMMTTAPYMDHLTLNENVASNLIYGHVARGDYKEADKILHLLDEQKIRYGSKVANSFILGAAVHGDADMLNEHIEISDCDDNVLVDALVLSANPGNEKVILNKLSNIERNETEYQFFTQICRRAVKHLVEKNNVSAAEQLVLLTKEIKVNSSKKEQVISISPSVILLSKMLESPQKPVDFISRVYKLKTVDSRIVPRAIDILFNVMLQDPTKKQFCISTTRLFFEELGLKQKLEAESLVGQNIARRLKRVKSENDAMFLLKESCDLGIKVTVIPSVWFLTLDIFIPENYFEDSKLLLSRIHEVREIFDCICVINGGIYSNSTVWGYITTFLLSYRTDVSFYVVAKIIKYHGCVYSPKSWYDKLGYALLATKDVQSYMKILEVTYKNSERRGDGEDFKQLCWSLLVVINTAKRNNQDIDDILEKVFQELWVRKIEIYQDVSEQLANKITNPFLAEAVKNLPILQYGDVRLNLPVSKRLRERGLQKKRMKRDKID